MPSPRRVDVETGLSRLHWYFNEHGHINVPKSYELLGWRAGLWVRELRRKYRVGRLSPAQIEAAEALGINWTPPQRRQRRPAVPRLTGAALRRQKDLDKLERLLPYFAAHGHINIPQSTIIDGWRAGRWVAQLRSAFRKGELDPKVAEPAEKLGIKWDIQNCPRVLVGREPAQIR